VRIKLDENIPATLTEPLTRLGHDVDSVPQEGLSGHEDATVWQAAQSSGRFFVTQDLDFSDIRAFKPGTHHGLLLIRLATPARRRLIERLHQVFQTESIKMWERCFVVVTDRKIRIRRPA